MKREYCPGCTYGPLKHAHNGQGPYCKAVADIKKEGLFARVLRFISGK